MSSNIITIGNYKLFTGTDQNGNVRTLQQTVYEYVYAINNEPATGIYLFSTPNDDRIINYVANTYNTDYDLHIITRGSPTIHNNTCDNLCIDTLSGLFYIDYAIGERYIYIFIFDNNDVRDIIYMDKKYFDLSTNIATQYVAWSSKIIENTNLSSLINMATDNSVDISEKLTDVVEKLGLSNIIKAVNLRIC